MDSVALASFPGFRLQKWACPITFPRKESLMRYAYLAALLGTLAVPSFASAQFFGFGFGVPVGHRGFVSFGYRGGYYGYPGYYYAPAPVTYVYPAPTTVVVSPPATVAQPPAAVAVSGQKARITV